MPFIPDKVFHCPLTWETSQFLNHSWKFFHSLLCSSLTSLHWVHSLPVLLEPNGVNIACTNHDTQLLLVSLYFSVGTVRTYTNVYPLMVVRCILSECTACVISVNFFDLPLNRDTSTCSSMCLSTVKYSLISHNSFCMWIVECGRLTGY